MQEINELLQKVLDYYANEKDCDNLSPVLDSIQHQIDHIQLILSKISRTLNCIHLKCSNEFSAALLPPMWEKLQRLLIPKIIAICKQFHLSVILIDWSLVESDIILLANVLKHHSDLTALRLHNCQIGDVGVLTLAATLKSKFRLKTLEILGDMSVAGIQTICQAVSDNIFLTNLNLGLASFNAVRSGFWVQNGSNSLVEQLVNRNCKLRELTRQIKIATENSDNDEIKKILYDMDNIMPDSIKKKPENFNIHHYYYFKQFLEKATQPSPPETIRYLEKTKDFINNPIPFFERTIMGNNIFHESNEIDECNPVEMTSMLLAINHYYPGFNEQIAPSLHDTLELQAHRLLTALAYKYTCNQEVKTFLCLFEPITHPQLASYYQTVWLELLAEAMPGVMAKAGLDAKLALSQLIFFLKRNRFYYPEIDNHHHYLLNQLFKDETINKGEQNSQLLSDKIAIIDFVCVKRIVNAALAWLLNDNMQFWEKVFLQNVAESDWHPIIMKYLLQSPTFIKELNNFVEGKEWMLLETFYFISISEIENCIQSVPKSAKYFTEAMFESFELERDSIKTPNLDKHIEKLKVRILKALPNVDKREESCEVPSFHRP